MKKLSYLLFITFLFTSLVSQSQAPVDSIKFFTDEGIIEISLTTDIRKLQNKESVDLLQPADITVKFLDGRSITEPIQLHPRGKSRRANCNLPPIMLEFHNASSPQLYNLSKLKLVVGCANSSNDEQLLLKEYLIYRIYNLFGEKSFRTRLAKVTYSDSRGKMKSYTQYAYLLEDVDDMAKRNNCKASKKISIAISETDPTLMNQVDVFEYMIGNTDWSVPGNHNIKIIYPRNDEKAKVFPVPYDFDNSGLVDAYYAIPNELIGTSSVKDRVYRGYSQPWPQVQKTLALFNSKKESIFAVINNFELLKPKTKSDIIKYLEEFYKTIDNESKAKSIFVDNTRDK